MTTIRCRTATRGRAGVVVAVAVVVLVGLAACGDDDDPTSAAGAETPMDLEQLAETEWVLVPDASTPTIGGEPSTLAWSDGLVSGTLQCNTYRGEMVVGEDGAVEAGVLASTMIGCSPEELMEDEALFATSLESVVAARIDDNGSLVLDGPNDEVHLVFTPFDAGAVMIGSWDITGINDLDAIRSPVEGTSPVLTFADDGTLTLTTGCNDLGTTWTLDGTAITVEPSMRTMMACEEPEGVMIQEDALHQALERSRTVQITRDHLTLLDEEGRIALSGIRDTEG